MSDQEAALAELLGEVNRGRVSPHGVEPAATTDARDDDVANLLNLGNLDITSDASTAPDDVFARLLDDESGLEAELMRYADHDVVRDIMQGEASGLKDRARDVTSKLRAVELESIQDYVGSPRTCFSCTSSSRGATISWPPWNRCSADLRAIWERSAARSRVCKTSRSG